MPTYRLGRLQFLIAGRDPIVPDLLEMFAPITAEPSGGEQLRFEFGGEVEARSGSTIAPYLSAFIGDDSFVVRNEMTAYRVAHHDGAIQVAARSTDPAWRERVGGWLAHAIGLDYAATSRKIADDFFNHIFIYLSQVAQLKVGQSYLHASGIERDGIGIAIVGGVSTGKTSTMLELVLKDGWRYLGNDLLPLGEDGVIWRSPEWMPVGALNMAGHELVRRGIMGRHHRVRNEAHLLWKRWRYGAEGAWVRVSPDRLFGAERIAPRARLQSVFFIERATVAHFSASPLSLEEACRRATMNLLGVLPRFVPLSLAVHTGMRTPVLPAIQTFYDNTVSVLADALEPVQRWAIRIPLRATPVEVADFLRTFLGSAGGEAGLMIDHQIQGSA